MLSFSQKKKTHLKKSKYVKIPKYETYNLNLKPTNYIQKFLKNGWARHNRKMENKGKTLKVRCI